MKEARYFYVPDAANATELPVEEAMHALRVLRLKSDDARENMERQYMHCDGSDKDDGQNRMVC